MTSEYLERPTRSKAEMRRELLSKLAAAELKFARQSELERRRMAWYREADRLRAQLSALGED